MYVTNYKPQFSKHKLFNTLNTKGKTNLMALHLLLMGPKSQAEPGHTSTTFREKSFNTIWLCEVHRPIKMSKMFEIHCTDLVFRCHKNVFYKCS